MKFKVIFIVFLGLCFNAVTPPAAYSFTTPHPIEIYEKGMGILYAYQGDPTQLSEAQDIFAELIRKYPNSPFGYLGMSRIYSIDAYLYGSHYNMEKIRDRAMPFAVKALELGPSIRDVHENYALFERVFTQYNLTQKHAQQALSLFPDRAETYFLVGNLMRNQGEYEMSVDYFKAALDLEPSESLRLKILERLAVIYLNHTKQPDKAIEYCNEAVKINDASPSFNEYLGRAYFEKQEYRLAVEKLTRSVKHIMMPIPQFYLLMAKGNLFAEEGVTEDAIDLLERAAEYRQQNSALHYTLGNLYYKQANYENAYYHFKYVINLKPHDPSAYYFAGRAASSLGNADVAHDYYSKYLQLNADSQEADWIRDNNPEFSQK